MTFIGAMGPKELITYLIQTMYSAV